QLGALLPALEKHKVCPQAQWDNLALEVYRHQLEAAATGGADRLAEVWDDIPRHLRQHPQLLRQYCAELVRAGAEQAAAARITVFLRKRWDPDLALAYGRLHAEDPV